MLYILLFYDGINKAEIHECYQLIHLFQKFHFFHLFFYILSFLVLVARANISYEYAVFSILIFNGDPFFIISIHTHWRTRNENDDENCGEEKLSFLIAISCMENEFIKWKIFRNHFVFCSLIRIENMLSHKGFVGCL